MMNTHAIIYSDGGCYSSRGAWAATIRHRITTDSGSIEKCLNAYVTETTNNRMELIGVLEGLRYLTSIRIQDGERMIVPRTVLLVSDSQYVMKGVSDYLDGWVQRSWKTSSGSAVKNQDLWEAMVLFKNQFRLTTQWVRGHSGHPENERCDKICTRLMKSGGLV